ncbi:hypothetical protein [Halorussus vallis]|nr:hypothetical protein [Halorussus vallis]
MAENLGEDWQGVLKALAVLVFVFGCLVTLIAFAGPSTVEHLLSG